MIPIYFPNIPHTFPIHSPHVPHSPPHLVVNHPTAELLGVGPDDLAVVPGAVVEGEGTYVLSVEARLSDLVVPVLSGAGDDN